ncbi:MAG: aromatic aminobenezylarsenical efflux permease ArsG family transporter [Paludibacteraceae bacterium]|nr:aromatic aminobenezylarsenical efflux permease ArsG family transporter [Paludibacteraceae bacterium]
MDLLNQLIDNSQVPVITAFLLGLLTALSPCPLATNVTAVGYIAHSYLEDSEDDGNTRRKILWSGLLYTLGRTLAYTLLGAILIYIIRQGADTFGLQQVVSEWGELILGPALILIGLFMLLGDKLHLPKFGFSGNVNGSYSGTLGSFALGILFAMAFCPTSGLLYFGMLIPMSAEATAGYLLPLVFAIATALPVLVVAWVLAYSMQSLGKVMGKISIFQRWFNRIVAILFIGVGIYYSITLVW